MSGSRSSIVALAAIAALARAGAVARAWELYSATPAELQNSTAGLAIRGRLLKASARLAPAAEAATLFAKAARAYAKADASGPAPYLLINAASMALLAGNRAGARAQAQIVLDRLDVPAPLDDTPYFLAATRAEALVLLGDARGAEAALASAVRADPDGWDDRAVTITQLAELCAAQGLHTDWLDRFRPPAALHFAGHMGLVSGGAREAELAAQVDALLAAQPIGFAYGALAAGADLIVAERLLALGAELHVVLPAPPGDFRRQSVAPAGAEWQRRFDAALAVAASVAVVGPHASGPHDPQATALAAEVAIGASLTAARRYATRARQWVVLDAAGGGANSAAQAARWPDRPSQSILTLPREGHTSAAFPPESNDPGRCDRVVLSIRADLAALGELPLSTGLARLHALVEGALPKGATIMRRAGAWDVLFATDAVAAEAALALLAAARADGVMLSAGLARGLVSVAGAIAAGPPLVMAERLALRAPAGVALADGLFAATSALAAPGNWQVQPYLADEPELGGTAWLLSR
jgi:hypothetical protein